MPTLKYRERIGEAFINLDGKCFDGASRSRPKFLNAEPDTACCPPTSRIEQERYALTSLVFLCGAGAWWKAFRLLRRR